MNILIVSYYFHPENSPRAFRTFELTRELARRGHVVKLILPNKQVFKEKPVQLENVQIAYVGAPIQQPPPATGSAAKENTIKKWVKGMYLFLNPFASTRPYIGQVSEYLKQSDTHYDLIISISFPVATHVGVGLALRSNRHLANGAVKVAEYSDPFSQRGDTPMFFAYKYLDKWIGKVFDYIVVPTEKAVDSYLSFKQADRIKVIPQGFDFSEVKLADYSPNGVPTFAYAGTFYADIRNPDFFFKHLASIKEDFRFVLFARGSNQFIHEMVHKYGALMGDKLVVHYDVPRLDLIYELSKMDFLVNIDNTTSNQLPSKLIDYALAKRPIYSMNKHSFDAGMLHEFLTASYQHQLAINIEKFDIRRIAAEFEQLSENREHIN